LPWLFKAFCASIWTIWLIFLSLWRMSLEFWCIPHFFKVFCGFHYAAYDIYEYICHILIVFTPQFPFHSPHTLPLIPP
jgi:hypothetical protein